MTDSYIVKTQKRLTAEGLADSPAKVLPKGTLLVAMYGATIGKLGILAIDAATNQACCALTLRNHLHTKFMFYTLLNMRQFLINQSYGGGQPNISQETVKQQYLFHPPKPEQEAIAQHLDTVTAQIDEAIAIKQQQVEKLENYWKTRLHEAVTKGLSEATAMKPGNDSYLGAVPTHWKVDRIKDIAEFNPWKPKISGDEIVSLIPMDCVSEDGKIGEVNSTTFEDVDKGLNYFEAGDVIFAKITPCMENGKGAFVKSLPTQYAFGSTEFFVFRPHGSILGSYLYYATRAEPFRQYAELNMKGAAGQQRVPSKFLATCEIAFPVDKQEQQAIVTVVIRQVLMTSMIQQGDLVLRCLTSQTLTPHWIMLVKIQQCPHCQSSNIVKNGHTRHQNQRVKCHDCGKTRVLMPKRKPLDWSAMERSLRERLSLRGIARVFRVSLETVLLLVKVTTQRLPACRESILPAHSQDIIEFDELWSYVQNKQQDRWLWTAICRRTRQIIAWAIGDHSQCTFKRLLRKMPHEYRRCVSYSDAWRAYNLLVNSSARHEKVGKESGQTNHMERWNNTLRQRISRYVRKALSFSKTDMFHQLTTKLFIWHYNLERINTF